MSIRILAPVALLLCAAIALADYPADRKAAADLMAAGKLDEALAAFLKLADAAAGDNQKSDALDQAAACAARLRKYDEAIRIAKRIPQPQTAKAAQMNAMLWNGKYEELVAAFKAEDFSAWPEKNAGLAYFCRGRAYITLRDGKAAEADMKKAVETLGEGEARNEARLLLGDIYRDLLQDDAQALVVYQENVAKAAKFGWIQMTSVVSVSAILVRQKKFDEALAAMKDYDPARMSGVWKYTFLMAYAELYAAQGKKAEAVAALKEGLAAKDLAAWQRPGFEQKLKELQGDAK
jgi:tetratricopeptide (TPR) repeat protein